MTWGELYSYGNKKSESNLDFIKKTTWDISETLFVSARNLWIENQNIFLYPN
jgi:hypothetical protein